MDSSVLNYSGLEAEKRLNTLEDQELDSPLGQLTADAYAEFLGLYLLTNDIVNAKLLWKRIPADLKLSCDELKAVWEVGKAAWKHDYTVLHQEIDAYNWSEIIKRIMNQFKINITEHCFNLISGGYTSIKLKYLADLLGMSEQRANEEVRKRGWTVIEQTSIVKPVKTSKEVNYTLENEEHLEKLTRHILFLET